jgi:NAD-dependent dihydropyrimidine dehydrogenase PreA subunit
MVDEKKRNFIKHLGLVSGAGLVGLGVAYGASTPQDVLVDDLEEVEQERGYRKVWATKRDEEENFGITYSEYLDDAERIGIWRCSQGGFIYDVTEGRKQRFDELPSDLVSEFPGCEGATKEDFENIGIGFRTGGQPIINEVVCAFHFDLDGDGEYADEDKGFYCGMPCRTVCPVDAITEGDFGTIVSEDNQNKRGPVVEFDTCIRCGRCHKICGYNSIEWVNKAYIGRGVESQGGGS